LRPWNLYSVLTQKYSWPSEKARQFSDFLEPMLDYDTRRRATAWDCLNHPWISGRRDVMVSFDPIQEKSSKKSQSSSPGRYDLRYGTYRPKLERGIFSAPAYGRRDLPIGKEFNGDKHEVREISKSAKSSPRYYAIDKIVESRGNSRKK